MCGLVLIPWNDFDFLLFPNFYYGLKTKMAAHTGSHSGMMSVWKGLIAFLCIRSTIFRCCLKMNSNTTWFRKKTLFMSEFIFLKVCLL